MLFHGDDRLLASCFLCFWGDSSMRLGCPARRFWTDPALDALDANDRKWEVIQMGYLCERGKFGGGEWEKIQWEVFEHGKGFY